MATSLEPPTRQPLVPPPFEPPPFDDDDPPSTDPDPGHASGVKDRRSGHVRSSEGLEPVHRAAVSELWYGSRRLVDSDRELEAGWKAVRRIAEGDGALSEAQRLALVGKMCATGVPPAVVEAVMMWGGGDGDGEHPADLLASVASTEDSRRAMRAWVFYEGASAALADPVIRLGEIERLLGVAATLGVMRGAADKLIELCCEEALLRALRVEVLREQTRGAVRSITEPDPSRAAKNWWR